MLEIHTPKSWRSIFSFPSIIVDDEGYIFNADDYHKFVRYPVGKIDYGSGYIYGEDYQKLVRTPIGCIEKDGDVTKVFGKDYDKLIRDPVLYIKGNEVYSYEEYHKLFSTPSYYIKSDAAKNSSGTDPAANNTRNGPTRNSGGTNPAVNNISSGPAKKEKDEKEESFWGRILKSILIVLVLIFLSVGSFNNFIHDSAYSGLILMSIPIGFIGALIAAKKDDPIHCILFVEVICVIVCYGGILAIDGDEVDIWEIIFSPFLIALMMAVPSIITGTIVYYIKKLFKK